jgi:hypothetical protein
VPLGWLTRDGPGQQLAERFFLRERVGEQAARILAVGCGLVHHVAPRPDGEISHELMIGSGGEQFAFEPLDLLDGNFCQRAGAVFP